MRFRWCPTRYSASFVVLRRWLTYDKKFYTLDPINPSEKLHVQLADEAVCIGPAPTRDSYLRMDKILEAVKSTGAQAVHPGYGFLSENTEFARLLTEAGAVFIGPNSKAILAMGDKIQSKRIATEAKVNMIPGYDGEVKDAEECVRVANDIGYPVMMKASAGGGGKGLRIAWNDKEAREGFRLSKQEAASSFGDDRMLVEKYIDNPRHIEMQVFCDKHGNAVWLNERECSIQRRNQKVIEEAPSPFVTPEMREKMGQQACSLALNVGYDSAGTVEFLVDSKRNFYFLEMNTRLQVEHPITEAITGVDLVQQMIRIAYGHKLNFAQRDVPIRGWAIECRVYAEDPYKSFGLPSVGRLSRYSEPLRIPGSRCDSGIYEGSEISIYYDPLICKLVTHGKDREQAMNRMRDALDEYVIRGVTNNIPLLRDIMTEERYRSGNITTKYLFETYPEGFRGIKLSNSETLCLAAVASALFCHHYLRAIRFLNTGRELFSRSDVQGSQRFAVDVPHIDKPVSSHLAEVKHMSWESCEVIIDETEYNIEGSLNFSKAVLNLKVNGEPFIFQIKSCNTSGKVTLLYKGCPYELKVLNAKAHNYMKHMPEPRQMDTSRVVLAPMPGMIKSVNVEVGQKVSEGQETCVIEAMKMQNSLLAPKTGTVKAVNSGGATKAKMATGFRFLIPKRAVHFTGALCYDEYSNRRFYDIGEHPYQRVWSVMKHDYERTRRRFIRAKYDYYKRIGKMTVPVQKIYDIELIPVECSVAIIGGGLAGSACAYWIKQRIRDDDMKLIVIENDSQLANSTTLLAPGGLWQQFSIPEKVQMSLFTAEFLRNADEHLKILDNDLPPIKFTPMNALFLASNEEEAAKLSEDCKCQTEFAFFKIKLKILARLASGSENEGVFDNWQLLSAIREKNVTLGVHYIKAKVTGFEWDWSSEHAANFLPPDKQWRYKRLRRVVIEPQYTDVAPRPIYATIFINCAGAWSGEVSEMAGFGVGPELLSIPFPIVRRKRYAFIFHCPDGPSLDMPYLFDSSGVWCRREGLGNLYMCGKNPSNDDADDSVDHSNLDVDYSFFDSHIWPVLAKRVPAFEKLKIKNAWAYYADVNEYDGNAIIGPHPFYQNYFHVGGFNGLSLQHALPAGRGIMEKILDGAYVSIDLRDFHLDRMLRGKRMACDS
ncbi:Propionyl-CoA carboxylase alpha chain, mitochondr ial [Trichuris trichiura]|uniref:Propionyl-CoA carboxylase alpha chain, mitochondrial n=1 Tax=Trichuris trichiura TaxID=36087 RepID=A0A077ZBT2_TRITR|nr:Propionyl-CoA carboxylase alpha chain, mitochondr ial [Trichuris trichiura]